MFFAGANAMPYRHLTVDNQFFIKRFSHRRRFRKTVRLLALADGLRLLDYGTGDGHLLTMLGDRPPRCELVGYEPMPSQFHDLQETVCGTPIQIVSNTGGLPDGGFDRIACCEVLEHLSERSQRRVLADIRRLLKPAGLVVITVPIEVGVASLVKNLTRIVIRQSHDEASLGRITQALLGMHSHREEHSGYIYGHVGFRHGDLVPLFQSAGLRMCRRAYSPLPWVGPLLNSQVLYVLRPV
jgi:2-polyprenyl-3-methyl-5-hydroxy-6-metoxy-1,4-benzoquinol methylase